MLLPIFLFHPWSDKITKIRLLKGYKKKSIYNICITFTTHLSEAPHHEHCKYWIQSNFYVELILDMWNTDLETLSDLPSPHRN